MAYPPDYKWSLVLKYNTANTLTGASSLTLYPAGIYAKNKIEGDEKTMLGGVLKPATLRRNTYTLPLMPFVYPDHVADFNAVQNVVCGKYYFWLYSDGTTYPEALSNIAVVRTAYDVSDEDDGTQRMTITFASRELL